jgi:hypothetical protein
MQLPYLIQILSKSNNIIITAVVDYSELEAAKEQLQPLVDANGYTIKTSVAHSLASLIKKLEMVYN